MPLRVDVRERREVVDGRAHVVHLLAAVVDLLHPLVAVARAAAVVRREHDVAALHRFDDEREHAGVPVAVHAAVHPDERGMLCRALVDRREQVRRNLEPVRAALVMDLLELVSPGRLRRVHAVRAALAGESALAHRRRAAAKVLRILAHVELARANAVHRAVPLRRPVPAAASAAAAAPRPPGLAAVVSWAISGAATSSARSSNRVIGILVRSTSGLIASG